MSSTFDHWQAVLAEAYDIDARLEPLAGEYDLNFRVRAADGPGYVMKVMRPDCEADLVDMQCEAIEHSLARDPNLPLPAIIPDKSRNRWRKHSDENGAPRLVWLLKRCHGTEYARFRPQTLSLAEKFGQILGRLDRALADFEHSGLSRGLKWDLAKADRFAAHVDSIADPSRRAIARDILARFDELKPALDAQPRQAIHNDANDYNILVRHPAGHGPQVTGLIDFGDMTLGSRATEIAIAGAYVVLDRKDPEQALARLVRGYHAENPLTGAETDLILPLLLIRLAVSVVNSALMQAERPDDPYVVISQAPIWRFLEKAGAIDEGLMACRLRAACDLPVTDSAPAVHAFLSENRGRFADVLGAYLTDAPLHPLSVRDAITPQDPFHLTKDEAATLGTEDARAETFLGLYGEPRLIYTADAFRNGPHKASDRRTVHIGVDIFSPPGTPVRAPLPGTVATAENRAARLDYGGMVILRHQTPQGDTFFTLYGHLDPASIAALQPGQAIERGEAFATLGDLNNNGGWAPHLHFQLALTTDGMEHDWPGVCDPDERYLWQAVCPNPAALLNLPDDRVQYRPLDTAAIAEKRRTNFATNLKLSYAEPCLFLRGWRHHLFDEWGRPYLDAYNNVPHVGHANPRIRAIAADQLARINSNTRYLHPAQIDFAEALLAKMPKHLTHVFFVNSGSEANELAMRLARARTGAKDMITPDHGYHGNTTGALALSAYKFNRPGGGGAPDWVHLVPVADTYRGEHRGADAAERYAAHVDDAIEDIAKKGRQLAGFIAETFPSVGGQIIPPPGYLPAVYEKVRAAGGVCIADEVQTGLGRLGHYYWGFEQQEAEPDIMVLGKPLGNGHPLGAVATTTEIAEAFDNGIEFFSTFGGSTLSCRTGREVIRIVDEEGLQENARTTGDHLLNGLRNLQTRHDIIGEVRGIGLFVGVDLVRDRATREPATAAADYVKNRLRERRILIGNEGPADNILKIRPPLTIGTDDIDMLLETLDAVLAETAFLETGV
ncbi:MAG: aminotransferase class III-fold pyridoxal phosphate-dependent enzyme [Paracoccaceae bacterium]